jgi:hypothetical protein
LVGRDRTLSTNSGFTVYPNLHARILECWVVWRAIAGFKMLEGDKLDITIGIAYPMVMLAFAQSDELMVNRLMMLNPTCGEGNLNHYIKIQRPRAIGLESNITLLLLPSYFFLD